MTACSGTGWCSVTSEKVDNFFRAVRNLAEVRDIEPPYSALIVTGAVGLIEVAYEAGWKAMKACLADAGYEEARTGSPRGILALAYQAQMIDDEAAWRAAHEGRNLLIHTYDEDKVREVISRIQETYLPLFERAAATLRDRWSAQ